MDAIVPENEYRWELKFQGAKVNPGSERSKERKFQCPSETFASVSELAWQRKGPVVLNDMPSAAFCPHQQHQRNRNDPVHNNLYTVPQSAQSLRQSWPTESEVVG